ncbi:hypothetical protein B0T24DRAFT_1283 [Lasiosphaeria ovina]|uniref:CFEM domain-containing protein n=1 Tax=Lasiosphaeria ovina TaxID=92902 RepID=A0AAE0TWJ2_9PEZI|nr:hypothetical protein B0T24DRAFT_1283 [Lasiosphaeria ovina]
MKPIAVVVASAWAAVAQTTGGLPPCGQICVNNMLSQGPELGCPTVNGAPDAACLCNKSNFGYGIRDCARQACPSADVGAVVNYGLTYCTSAAAAAAGPDSASSITVPPAISALGGPGAGVLLSPPPTLSTPLSAPSSAPLTPPASAPTGPVAATYTIGGATIVTTIAPSDLAPGLVPVPVQTLNSSTTEVVVVSNSSTTVTSLTTRQLVSVSTTDPAAVSTTTENSRTSTRTTRTTSAASSTSSSESTAGGMPIATIVKDNIFLGAVAVAAAVFL